MKTGLGALWMAVMFIFSMTGCAAFGVALLMSSALLGQVAPYDQAPAVAEPYFRVRMEVSSQPGELIFPVTYTVWIPAGVKNLRGVIVHQHGCGEGSCRSGQTGAFDLHWQALAKKHDCALLAPSYEQPDKADCQMWCDPRNGSAAAFQKALVELGAQAGHPELSQVPWALWGHSGGGHWAGGMLMLFPERVAAVWLRSGVPLLVANPERATIQPHTVPAAALQVPVMCNLGTKEGVSEKEGRFAGVWPSNETFFRTMRRQGALIGVAVDPLTSHECGNQRYLAIPWLDACLTARLPAAGGPSLRAMPAAAAWLSPLAVEKADEAKPMPADQFAGEVAASVWLPNEAVAKAWVAYVKDTQVPDATPPPAPTQLTVQGNELTWEAEADLESGLAGFIIERDGEALSQQPLAGKNPFGRAVFQGLQYSDTPLQPLVERRFTDTQAVAGKTHQYRVISVNTVGLKSP
jgi:pimeloyl-ACP methyl ester carboxylesterase